MQTQGAQFHTAVKHNKLQVGSISLVGTNVSQDLIDSDLPNVSSRDQGPGTPAAPSKNSGKPALSSGYARREQLQPNQADR